MTTSRIALHYLVDPKNSSHTINIFSVYAPTEKDPRKEAPRFYATLKRLLRQHRAFCIIVCGDFNARVQGRVSPQDFRFGPHSYHSMTSENGDRLVDLVYTQRLFHLNSFFQKQTERRWTWRSEHDGSFAEIDHILCNRIQLASDCEVVVGLETGSDHRMVRSTIFLPPGASLKRARLSKRAICGPDYLAEESPRLPSCLRLHR